MENQINELERLKQEMNGIAETHKGEVRKTKEEILSKYFNLANDTEKIRILPNSTGNFKTVAYFHNIQITVGNGIKRNVAIYCPKHNDAKVDGKYQPCPLCEKSDAILAKQDNTIKYVKKVNMTPQQLEINEKNKLIFAEAMKFKARKHYILKIIDKGVEKDGVKFWRFKENYKKTGVMDKLEPILNQYLNKYNKSFLSELEGTDVTLMTQNLENTFKRGTFYRSVVAIATDEPSLLHQDPLVRQQWLNDKTSWRDVFKPKKAPNVTPQQFMEMVLNGVEPYWDDSDQNNKHWVFPNNPELEKMANTRDQDLGANKEDDFEQASDLTSKLVSVDNVTASDVGTYTDGSTDVGAAVMAEKPAPVVENQVAAATEVPQKQEQTENVVDADLNPSTTGGDYDDLPF